VNTTLLFRLSFIALFLLSYQSSTIHTKHHHVESITKCSICHAAKTSGKGHHQHSVTHFNESVGIEVSQVETKPITRQAFSLEPSPFCQLNDFDGLKVANIPAIAKGYFSTAPPCFS
jgi:hypothetical protein